MEKLKIKIERVIKEVARDGKPGAWYLLATDKGTCKGTIAWRVKTGDELILRGIYVVYKGERQFDFKGAALDIPEDSRGRLHYVCERTQGIGPAMEKTIWETYGERWPDLSDGVIPRLGADKVEIFHDTLKLLNEDGEKADVTAYLQGVGCTENMAMAAWEMWKEKAPGIVRDNCYRLAELSGYGFKDVDTRVRPHFDIPDDDPRRIRACINYCFEEGTKGATVMNWQSLRIAVLGMLHLQNGDLIGDEAFAMFNEKQLYYFEQGGRVTLPKYYNAETRILQFVIGGHNVA